MDDILDTRIRYHKRQYLVHWKDTSPAIDNWEPKENLQKLDALKNFLSRDPEVQQDIKDNKERKNRQQTQASRKRGSAEMTVSRLGG